MGGPGAPTAFSGNLAEKATWGRHRGSSSPTPKYSHCGSPPHSAPLDRGGGKSPCLAQLARRRAAPKHIVGAISTCLPLPVAQASLGGSVGVLVGRLRVGKHVGGTRRTSSPPAVSWGYVVRLRAGEGVCQLRPRGARSLPVTLLPGPATSTAGTL